MHERQGAGLTDESSWLTRRLKKQNTSGEKGGGGCIYRVVDTPHQHAEDGLARTEQLDFLSYKMLLFRLGLAGADGRRARAVG